MMRDFYNGDFEELIRQKADQYKMYPSEKVWKEINRSLHSRRKWYWSGLVLLLSGVSYFAIQQLITPSTRIAKNNQVDKSASASTKQAVILPFESYIPTAPAIGDKSDITTNKSSAPVINMFPVPTKESIQLSNGYHRNTREISGVSDNTTPITWQEDIFTPNDAAVVIQQQSTLSDGVISLPSLMDKIVIADQQSTNQSSAGSEQFEKINWLQENAVYELLAPKMKRTSLQFAFSPTMNYRKLTGSRNANMRTDSKSIPIAMNVEGDLDKLVKHKPALGFELGTSILYSANKNLTLKAGIQFNYSRYDIEAYSSYSAEIATIALSNNFGVDLDSITNYTRIRNFGGDAEKDLRNQYFQFSAPVGIEYRILGGDRLQVKVAGTLQPTYLINRNSYLITTDYKNYTREPSLVRRFNLNTSAEAFIAYKAAGLKWQVGPQFRYQLLSSYANKYPIKEYLMEYGIKVGVSKTIR